MMNWKRVIAFLLTLCIVVTLMPPVQRSYAADVERRYELDTDGVDPGATYLIVDAGYTGYANALKFYYVGTGSNQCDLRNQEVTIKEADGVLYIASGFTNESECTFQFSAPNAGSITHGNYYLNLGGAKYGVGTTGTTTINFLHIGNGQYEISCYYRSRDYYLYYNTGARDWRSGTSPSSVYLYKLVGEEEPSYNVTFDGNGYTSGKLPENATGLASGDTYIVPAAPEALRKDVGDDTWLFLCWKTANDGSGTEYHPGDEITITEDLTLYASWYQQTKYTLSMITNLNGTPTDIEEIAGYDRTFYALLEGGDGTYIPLTRRSEGTYSAKVTENGEYVIYAKNAEGEYEPVHGHVVVIRNQDGITVCQHFTVSYNTQGGAWAEGQNPGSHMCHTIESVVLSENVPTLAGNRFLYWKDQDGNTYAPGASIQNIQKEIILSAVWEETIRVTIQVVIDHNSADGGVNNADDRDKVELQIHREENGVNLPVEHQVLQGNYDRETNTSTYTVVLYDQTQAIYHVACVKTGYETAITQIGKADEDQVITVNLQYAPDNFDLVFDVKVNADSEAEKALMPQAVNVKVTYWGYNKDGELGWHIITQQAGNNAPTTITIDENGEGRGFFPVWSYWASTVQAYEYRVEVTSFVMPDGSIVPASGDYVVYTADGSGLYQATVSVENGRVPGYPDDSNTDLSGAYYDGNGQAGQILVTVDITPFTVTFDAGEGKVNDKKTLTLENQYRYPQLDQYVAVSDSENRMFIGWTDADGNPVPDLSGQLLTESVTYYARYSECISVSGTVSADATYMQGEQLVHIHDIDRATTVWVVLQKKVGDVYNDMRSVAVELIYETDEDGRATVGLGTYSFEDLPNDGTEYRVHILVNNYDAAYDHDQDGSFSDAEATLHFGVSAFEAQVDIDLSFAPTQYQQAIIVDTSQIQQDLRPTGVLAQVIYRDLGEAYHYAVISQHTVDPYGIKMTLPAGHASTFAISDLWCWHTNGTLYEYQVQITTVYGNNVTNAYNQQGMDYTADRPYTVVYGAPNNYLRQEQEGGAMLKATLVPKKFAVNLDLNLGDDTDTPVYGLEKYMVDSKSGEARYAFMHTWSFAESFVAYPYREGYVFDGWESPNEEDVYIKDGVIYVGTILDHDITLTAKWKKLSGTDYTIRYLELNTDKVLQGATMVSGAVQGSKILATDCATPIEGYVYAGALVGGIYADKDKNPAMTVAEDPSKNLMVIYYLPDGSDGYTEQVESNLEINKSAVLENDGTYTITLDTYTKDNPITTLIQQNTPLDIVLVMDQSESVIEGMYLDDLQAAVDNFVDMVSAHGQANKVDHRIALVGYAGDEDSQAVTDTSWRPIAGGNTSEWVNTGIFDSNGVFHPIYITGFNYTRYEGDVYPTEETENGTVKTVYYALAHDEYVLLTYHETYYHLITPEEARLATLSGTQVYGQVGEKFIELTRNSSGLWLDKDKQLYSQQEFFTLHEDVWTHRHDTERREIHAYGTGKNYREMDDHSGVYVREITKEANPELSVYRDALIPVSASLNGSGGLNPSLENAGERLASNGQTYPQYGIRMANQVLAANPLEEGSDRIRIVVLFTDGMPGDGNFSEEEANAAIAEAYKTKNDYGAYLYTVGLYTDATVAENAYQAYFMNAVSYNYPEAETMDDVRAEFTYTTAPDISSIETGGPYFVIEDGQAYELTFGLKYENKIYYYCWYYVGHNGRVDVHVVEGSRQDPAIVDGKIGNFEIFKKSGSGYQPTEHSGYYSIMNSASELDRYFTNIVQDITTKVTTEIVLESDTILRDIMNQGLVMTEDTVITVYLQEGNYNKTTAQIDWGTDLDEIVKLELKSGATTATGTDNNVQIITYNMDAANATDPNGADYHPHAVDITGYDFFHWYISEDHMGYKMVVTITRVEATDDVVWGRSTATNNEQSGLWLPADENGDRELLLPFDQPTTIFVERAYVLDYGKEFTLSNWYFDDDAETGKEATPIHLDFDITDGMNGFDVNAPTTQNGKGDTKYGNVRLENGKVTYNPTTMNWGGADSFYVFGNTWRKTVLAQDANENGNLWNKVTVIPANNIYYEDSFVTTESTTQNGIEGFTFTGDWSVVGKDSGNTENPEQLESAPYGDVHGWTDSLGDDVTFTDGSAHFTNTPGASAQFTFTGTGVEVYTRTNATSGMVVAVLSSKAVDENGREVLTLYRSLAMDNLAMSGDYYHIPTVAFKNLPYGTYTLQLIATVAEIPETGPRYEYYIDGVRIHNPLGNTTNYQSDMIKDAYGLENNAVFTEVRDILLDYGDFNVDMPDSTNGKAGAVFIDWLRDGQGTGNDTPGVGVPTYEIGTFETYGPKNEVYLSAGQAIVLKADSANTYYVGLKSLNGMAVNANLSGLDTGDPTTIQLQHTTDMYYRVTPVDGYIVIQNGNADGAILSVTNLRTTNQDKPVAGGGVLTIAAEDAVEVMRKFSLYLQQKQEQNQIPTPDEPVEELPSAWDQVLANLERAEALFAYVRQWLKTY